jgi:hypothetical protein
MNGVNSASSSLMLFCTARMVDVGSNVRIATDGVLTLRASVNN